MATVNFPSGSVNGNNSSTVDLAISDLTGVAAIEFVFNDQQNGYVGYKELSATGTPIGSTGMSWTGVADSTWANASNWIGGVPGVSGATNGSATNTDTAMFNQAASFSPTTIDAGRNVMNITFDI